MTTIISHDRTKPETSTSKPAQRHSPQQRNATTMSHKTKKTDAHLCITIRWSAPPLDVTAHRGLACGLARHVVDLGGWC